MNPYNASYNYIYIKTHKRTRPCARLNVHARGGKASLLDSFARAQALSANIVNSVCIKTSARIIRVSQRQATQRSTNSTNQTFSGSLKQFLTPS